MRCGSSRKARASWRVQGMQKEEIIKPEWISILEELLENSRKKKIGDSGGKHESESS